MFLDRDDCDPVVKICKEILKYPAEKNWANNVFDLCSKYNLSLYDENIANITKPLWKIMAKNQVKKLAFQALYNASLTIKKTKHLRYSFERQGKLHE